MALTVLPRDEHENPVRRPQRRRAPPADLAHQVRIAQRLLAECRRAQARAPEKRAHPRNELPFERLHARTLYDLSQVRQPIANPLSVHSVYSCPTCPRSGRGRRQRRGKTPPLANCGVIVERCEIGPTRPVGLGLPRTAPRRWKGRADRRRGRRVAGAPGRNEDEPLGLPLAGLTDGRVTRRSTPMWPYSALPLPLGDRRSSI